MTSQQIESVIQRLRTGRAETRIEARDLLLEWAEDEVHKEPLLALLAPLFADPDPFLRSTAVWGYSLLQAENSLERLLHFENDPDPLVRGSLAAAISAIGTGLDADNKLKVAEVGEILLRLLNDRQFEVRFAAAQGLAKMHNPAGAPVLVEGLTNRQLRLDALMSLLTVGDQQTIPGVRRCFRKLFASGFERVAAAGVLARLGDEEASYWLVERIRQRRNFGSMGGIGGGAERGLAIEIAGELKLLAATDALHATLRDRADLFRGAAARSLGRMQEERWIEEFASILTDESEDDDVRMDVAEGLMLLGTSKAQEALKVAALTVNNKEVGGAVREILESVER